MIPIHLLTDPAHECTVPRELRFDLASEQRADKPLWTWEEAFEAIGALEDAGAAVVQGEIVVVAESGEAKQVPWEPWLRGAPNADYPPPTRRWRCERADDEPWGAFVVRAAAYARKRARELAGEARATPAGAVHVDLAWATEDELALFDLPGWDRRARRRLIEQGGGARDWFRRPSWRMRCVGPTAPGSYFGVVSADLREIPADARYASLTPRAKNMARMLEFTRLEVLWAAACTDRTLPHVGRLATLRELYLLNDTRLSSLEPVAGLTALEFAYIGAGRRLADPGPLPGMRRLRYLYLNATGLHDLSAFRGLTQLNSLHLVPAKTVDSLAPLRSLTGLRHLSLWMDGVRDGSLAPLAALRGLRSLEVSPDRFPLDQLTRLAAALPSTEGPHRTPFLCRDDPAASETCKRCGGGEVYVTAGKPRRVLCAGCHASAIRQHVIRWEILLSAPTAIERANSSSG
ncbi:MAG TPA: leucine-rich repeat domain-containing protein [Longimicrobium sp.]|nr:leucine-rich repeat domain-containing protein [Longimicrobium sp.]